MSLETVRKTFEAFGRDDPLYAVLTREEMRHGRWDPEAFFATGRAEIAAALGYLDGLGAPPARGAALDFGCAVGRLTQALADHFATVTGVDIAASMIARARDFNRHGDRVTYLVNTTDDLTQLPAASFDFVYSNITLQHIPPEFAIRYIREFVRLLRPGGVALFQEPHGPAFAPGSLAAWWYTVRRRHLRRLWKVIRGRAPYEMHYLPRAAVEAAVVEAGGKVLDVQDVGVGRRRGVNLRYAVQRPPA